MSNNNSTQKIGRSYLSAYKRVLPCILLSCIGVLGIQPLWANEEGEDTLQAIQKSGRLRVAVYKEFAPFADKGVGIDYDIANALAEKLNVKANIIGYGDDESVDDDLRNMVWKGHYLGPRPAHVMLHVPVDRRLSERNEQVKIFGGYHFKVVAMARIPSVKAPIGSAAISLEGFTREKIGVQIETLADSFLMSVLHGRLRENIKHYGSIKKAVSALKSGEISAVIGMQSELENLLQGETKFLIDPVEFPELQIRSWPIGLAVKSDQKPLAAALDKGMKQLLQDGTISGIFKKYGVSHTPPGKNKKPAIAAK